MGNLTGEVKVEWRSVYGQDLAYPANPLARLLCDIAGTKTLTPAMTNIAMAHGLTITA